MNRLWDIAIRPCLELSKAKNIVEIGSDLGRGTSKLIEYCRENNGKLVSIDPAPNFDYEKWEKENEGIFKLHKDLSLSRLPLLKEYDAILIDGDHNWYTVYNELKIIEKVFGVDRLPLIILHDMLWPYARRDLYYKPETIPEGYRQAYEQKGMLPGELNLVEDGGFNSHLFNAIYENNPRNGIRTAVEDFLNETNKKDLKLNVISAFHGIGVITDNSNKNVQEYLESTEFLNRINLILEDKRVEQLIEVNSIRKDRDNRREEIKKIQKELVEEKEHADILQKELVEKKEHADILQKELVEEKEHTDSLQKELIKEKEYADVLKNKLAIEKEQEINNLRNKISYLNKEKDSLYKQVQVALTKNNQLEQYKIKEKQARLEAETHFNSARYKIGSLIVDSYYNPKLIFKIPSKLKSIYKQKKNKQSNINNNLKKEEIETQLVEKEINKYNEYKVDVVVCVHNALDCVKECIESLYDKRTVHFNLILVDDGSEIETKNYLQCIANEKNTTLIRHEQAQGYTIAANKGLKASKGDFSILLNSDTIVTYGWIEKLIDCANIDNKTGIVGPLSNAASWQTVPDVFANGDWKVNILPEGINLDTMGMIIEKASIKEYPIVPFINGFCFCIKRSVINSIGYLDEETFPKGYGEENDFCIRALKAGFKLRVCDTCYIFHEKSKSFTHERRKALSSNASNLLKNKHGDQYVNELINSIKDDFSFLQIRKRIINMLEYYQENFKLKNKKIAFLLPANGGGGGANSIVQELKGMRLLGINVDILNKESCYNTFSSNYPDIVDYIKKYRNQEELEELCGKYDIVIGTIYHTIENLVKMKQNHPNVKLAYYVQDYEPMFFTTDNEEYLKARNSYELMKNELLFAKTDWICKKVNEEHNINLNKVNPSIDWEFYNPYITRVSELNLGEQLTITAMVRPSTPRRAPQKTIELLGKIKKANPKVSINIFGCRDEELFEYESYLDYEYVNHGHLKRNQVTELLRNSDIFIDMSTYQAFGRTGLEAMAVGCAAVLPNLGGIYEYARDGENSIIADTDNVDEVFVRVQEVIDNRNYLLNLKINGIQTAKEYSILNASWSELWCLNDLYNNDIHVDSKNNIGYMYTTMKCGRPTGSSYHRVLYPMDSINDNDINYRPIRIKPDDLEYANISCLIIQRDCIKSLDVMERVFKRCKERKIRIVWEVDDYIWESSMLLNRIIEQADIITTSTDELKNKLMELNPNVFVNQNHLNNSIYNYVKLRTKQKTNNTHRGVFIGTPSHKSGINMVKPYINQLQHNSKIEFDIIGFKDEELSSLSVDVDNYPNFIKSLIPVVNKYNFGIAPLMHTEFDKCKSNLKYLEYTMFGIVGLYSNIGPYKNIPNKCGILVDDVQEWNQKLEEVLNANNLEEMLIEARADIEQNYLMENPGYQKWLEIIRDYA